MAGQVRADGQVVAKPSSMLAPEAQLEVERGPRFVSRGGEKLEAALAEFGMEIGGAVCADVGSSTGGFTDCLLQHGAAKVHAIDVGKGQLDWRLRRDARVVVMEKTNARFVEAMPEPVHVVTIDASFISLSILLPVVRNWLAPEGQLVALIKPQFEAGKREVGRGKGVIRDANIHRRVLEEILASAREAGFGLAGLMRSPIQGPKGNMEFLLWARKDLSNSVEPETLIASVFADQV